MKLGHKQSKVLNKVKAILRNWQKHDMKLICYILLYWVS